MESADVTLRRESPLRFRGLRGFFWNLSRAPLDRRGQGNLTRRFLGGAEPDHGHLILCRASSRRLRPAPVFGRRPCLPS